MDQKMFQISAISLFILKKKKGRDQHDAAVVTCAPPPSIAYPEVFGAVCKEAFVLPWTSDDGDIAVWVTYVFVLVIFYFDVCSFY